MKKTVIEIKNGEVIAASSNEKELVKIFRYILLDDVQSTTRILYGLAQNGLDEDDYDRDVLISTYEGGIELTGMAYGIVSAVINNLAVLIDEDDVIKIIKYIQEQQLS